MELLIAKNIAYKIVPDTPLVDDQEHCFDEDGGYLLVGLSSSWCGKWHVILLDKKATLLEQLGKKKAIFPDQRELFYRHFQEIQILGRLLRDSLFRPYKNEGIFTSFAVTSLAEKREDLLHQVHIRDKSRRQRLLKREGLDQASLMAAINVREFLNLFSFRARVTEVMKVINNQDIETLVEVLQVEGEEVFKGQDLDGWTPLTWAFHKQYREIIEFLVQAVGIRNIDEADGRGNVPRQMAANLRCGKWLENFIAVCDEENSRMETTLEDDI